MSATATRLAGPPGSAAVAAGSAPVVAAAVEILRAGGCAVDAALAGAFAAVMSEPVLASLGGGGFLMWSDADGTPSVLDFFVDVPGRGGDRVDPHVETVIVDFARTGSAAASSTQVFHGGWGTVAVPGCLSGYLAAHSAAGRLPLADVVAPAAALARDGVDLAPGQVTFMHLVEELLSLTPDGRRLFSRAERTGRYVNLAYGMLLRELGAGRITALDDHAFASTLVGASRAGGGLLTRADLAEYRAVRREPRSLARAHAHVWTNPAPSVGGSIIAEALAGIGPAIRRADASIDWAAVAAALADATARQRGPGQVPTGTTHISVVDAHGSFAAITTSNGSGSGCVVPGWGVALNNMLGEEDLRPSDGTALAPGARMGSMMAPTIVDLPDGSRAALGTGGSERIRSALLGVLIRLIDERLPLADAVAAPRVHVTPTGPVHAEPGLSAADVTGLRALAEHRAWGEVEIWGAPNLYFGGVHAVRRAADGSVEAVGDVRRTGTVGIVHPDGRIEAAG